MILLARSTYAYLASTRHCVASYLRLTPAVILGIVFCSAASAQTAHFSGAEVALGGGFSQPRGMAVDTSGNVYVVDSGNNAVKEIPAGCLTSTCVVQLGGSYGFVGPKGIGVDASGNVFVADSGANMVEELTPNCTNSSCVKVLGGGYSFNNPTAVNVDAFGNVFVAVYGAHTVAEIPTGCSTAGCVKTIGSGFTSPDALVIDSSGNVFVTDSGTNYVSEISTVSTPYDTTTRLATGFSFYSLSGIAVDSSGNLFVADSTMNAVEELTYASGYGTVVTLASGFSYPNGVAVDASGNVYLGDYGDNEVEKVMTSNVNIGSMNVGSTSSAVQLIFTFHTGGAIVTPVVLTQGAANLDFKDSGGGTCTSQGSSYSNSAGGTCTVDVTFTPKYPGPRYGAVLLEDGAGNVLATAFIYGTGTGPMANFLPGTVTTLTNGNFSSPVDVAVDGSGNLFVADQNQNAVKEIVAAGGYTTVNTLAVANGNFSIPHGVAVDGAGNVFVADKGHDAVKEIVAAGGYTTVNTLAVANGNFFAPSGVAVDGSGNVFVADYNHNAVKQIAAVGGYTAVNTLAVANGNFLGPYDVAVDGSGNVLVADLGNNAVKKIVAAGGYTTVNTLGGSLASPYGAAVDGSGNVFVADLGVSAVGKIDFADPPSLNYASTPVGSTSSAQLVTVQNIGNQPLDFIALDIATTSQTANSFNLNASGTSCTVSTPLAAGETCGLDVEFQPASSIALTGTVSITDNNLNSASPNYAVQQIDLSGTGLAPVVVALAIAAPPPTTQAAGGNAGTVVVDEESSTGAVITTASDLITLTVTSPNGYSHSYTATAVSGVASFNLSGAALTAAGIYTYTASISGGPSATATETVTALTTVASLVVSGYPAIAYSGLPAIGMAAVLDTYNNVVTGFSGTVNITTTDSAATVTTPVAIISGEGSFTVTFATVGRQSITASATGIISIPETGITVNQIPSFVVTSATDMTAGVATNCPGVSCSLRDALAAASQAGAGNITFSPTAFASAQTIMLSRTAATTLMVPPNTSITGPTTGSGTSLTNLVTVDGASTYTVFTTGYSSPASITAIANLNIQNGNGGADGYGGPGSSGGAGGINNYGALTVTHCVFATNTGTDAGAIYNWDGVLTVSASNFTGNSSSGGSTTNGWYGDAGAIFNDDNQVVQLSPGAVGANGLRPLATVSTTQRRYHTRGQKSGSRSGVRAAVQHPAGGAIASGTLTVTSSTFAGNSGTYTGGIFNYATAAVTNSTFGGTATGAGNTSSGDGAGDPDAGAMNNDTDVVSSSATVTNSTFTNNTGVLGGAIINADDDFIGATLQVQGSTFTGNISSGDSNKDLDAGAIDTTWGESGPVNSSTEIAYSTFSNNRSSSQSGSGAISNGYRAATVVVATTLTGNTGYHGAADGDRTGSTAIANSIASGNATTDPTASTDGITPDLNGFSSQGGNVAGPSATNLASLANYGGPTQTMIPLPGSTAICAGSFSVLQAAISAGLSLTTDQRGLPNTNSSYPGYSSTACVDAGSVQTNYAIAYTTPMPSSAQAGVAITPAPVVQLTESSQPAIFAASTITLSDSAKPTALGGTTAATFVQGSASFSDLLFTLPVSGDMLTATLPLNLSLTPALNLTLSSMASGTGTNLIVTPSVLPNGKVNVLFASVLFSTSGGAAPYTYTVTKGSLPSGLTLTGGVLGGTPTATGTFSITVTVKDSNGTTGTQSYTLTVNAGTVMLSVSASPTVVTPLQAVTLAATLTTSGPAMPTGTVTFFANGVQAGQPVNVTGGAVQMVLPSLPAGATVVITAAYSGDGDFAGSASINSVSVVMAPLDFVFTNTGAVAYTAVPGAVASYSFGLAPLYGSYPGPISFTVTGLPAGAVATFTPSSPAVGGGAFPVWMTVQTAPVTALNRESGRPLGGGIVLALLLLPFLGKRSVRDRLKGKMLLVVLLMAGAMATLTGCGSNNGFLLQSQQSYTLTVNATSGAMQHSQTVTLIVQ